MIELLIIELLIIVAIIGILAAIAAPNFLNAQGRTNVARTQFDMHSVVTAIEFSDWTRVIYWWIFWDDDEAKVQVRWEASFGKVGPSHISFCC